MAQAKYVITDTKELADLRNRLNSLSLKSNEKIAILKSLAVEIKTQTEERFSLQESAEGDRWKAISQKTKEYYARRGTTGGSILNRSGQLRDSLDIEVTENEAVMGATKIYSAVHQFGLNKKNIPARPYLGVSSENITELENIITNYIQKIAEKK